MGSDRKKAKEDDANAKLSYLYQDVERYEGDGQPTGCEYDQCDFCPSWIPPFIKATREIRISLWVYSYKPIEIGM